MSYIVIPPVAPLQNHVSHFWVAEWDVTELINTTYYATANSLTEIAFAFAGKQKGSDLVFASVQGQTDIHGQYESSNFGGMFGVALYSHAVQSLFHCSSSELHNRFFSPETLLGKYGAELTEKIALASDTQHRVQILSAFFMNQLKKGRNEDSIIGSAIKLVRASKGNLNITELAKECCLSQKQFERRFKTYSGFNPKLYARIIRFENVLNNRKHYPLLTEAAHAVGYYDQAHFIRDFKQFSGFSPNKFFDLSGY